jgi:hypothetical protein
MSTSFQVVGDFPARLGFLAFDQHFHLPLLGPNDHRLLAHPAHHVKGALRFASQGQFERILLDAALDDLA